MPCRYSESMPATTGLGGLDRRGVDAQHFTHAIHDDAYDLIAQLDDDDAAGAGGRRSANRSGGANRPPG